MLKIVLVILFIANWCLSFAQHQLLGRVLDLETKKPVANAIVYLEGDTTTTKTNVLGYFQLEIDTNAVVIVEASGYNSGKIPVDANENISVLLEGKYPQYEGGFSKLYEYWSYNIRYPVKARRKNLQGWVLISFEIDPLGTLKKFKSCQGYR